MRLEELRIVSGTTAELKHPRARRQQREVLLHGSGRGKRSGLELQQMLTEGAHLFHLRDGKVIRHVAYQDRKLAFADLGLESDIGV